MEFLESEGLIFDIIITGTDVINYKPSADGIHEVMKRFNLVAEQVLMVGDSVADVKAANDYIFHDVSEFEVWLKNIFIQKN